MLAKGIIQSIESTGNKCTVRLPIFETAGTKTNFVSEAVISSSPGIYNGYSVGDVVLVGFGAGGYGDAVVIGKLYLGVSSEKSTIGGSVHCSDLAVDNSATLPATVRLGFSSDSSDASTVKTDKTIDISSYSTLKALATAVAENSLAISELEESAVGEVSVYPSYDEGTKIATIAIDGASYDLYTPAGQGQSVSFASDLESGTQIGILTVDGQEFAIYAPNRETGLKISDSENGAEDAEAGNGSVYLNLTENGEIKDAHLIIGAGGTSVTAKDGVITITSTGSDISYSAGSGLTLDGTTFSVNTNYSTDGANRNYKVSADDSGSLYVNVPWADTDTVYTLPTATSATLGGVTLSDSIEGSETADDGAAATPSAVSSLKGKIEDGSITANKAAYLTNGAVSVSIAPSLAQDNGTIPTVVALTDDEYSTLQTEGTVTASDGVTYTYDSNVLYLTPKAETTEIGTATADAEGIVKLSDTASSSSTASNGVAATPAAISTAISGLEDVYLPYKLDGGDVDSCYSLTAAGVTSYTQISATQTLAVSTESLTDYANSVLLNISQVSYPRYAQNIILAPSAAPLKKTTSGSGIIGTTTTYANAISLGSSSYPFYNVYATNYYRVEDGAEYDLSDSLYGANDWIELGVSSSSTTSWYYYIPKTDLFGSGTEAMIVGYEQYSVTVSDENTDDTTIYTRPFGPVFLTSAMFGYSVTSDTHTYTCDVRLPIIGASSSGLNSSSYMDRLCIKQEDSTNIYFRIYYGTTTSTNQSYRTSDCKMYIKVLYRG